MTASIHLWNASCPDDDENTFPICVTSHVIPRVGDDVAFWVDWPTHLPSAVEPEPGEPCRVSGKVARVLIEYRQMRGWGSSAQLHEYVSVYLAEYQATLFPHGKPRVLQNGDDDE